MTTSLNEKQLLTTRPSYHGVATHYIHSSNLPNLSARLAELRFDDFASLATRTASINDTISEFTTSFPTAKPTISGVLRQQIDRCFAHDDPLAILSDLKELEESTTAPEDIRKWAGKTHATIRERSPIGVAVTLRQMRLGRSWNIAQAFRNEHAIAAQFMAHSDFVTGVTARLIERSKSRPDWNPNQLEDVTKEDVDKFFENIDSPSGLKLMTTGEHAMYDRYPHAQYALPTEEDILAVRLGLAQGNMVLRRDDEPKGPVSRQETMKFFSEKTGAKVGVKEKVAEVLDRYGLS